MKRRDFLITAGMSAAALARLQSRLWAQAGALPDRGKPAAVSPAKLERVSIMTYNFTSVMKLESQPASPDRTLELFDIADMFADIYGVHNVEVQHSHLASTDAAYLKELRARIEKAKSRMTQINVEFGPMTISAADPVQRNQAIDLTMRWVDHAVALNCPRVMINQGQLTPESKARSTVALQAMGEYGKSKNVRISVETRVVGGGRGAAPAPADAPPAPGLPLSAPGGPPAWLLVKEIVEATGTYSNVDVGNIRAPDQDSLHMVIKGLFPTTSGNMHIKVSPAWDLATAIRFTNNELGYQGLYSIEVEPSLIRGVYDTILASI